jgi:hypothetical protein
VFTERAPVTVRHEALICSTLQSGICIDVLMTLWRDVYWVCAVRFPLVRYWSHTSDIRLCSSMQKILVLFPIGGGIAMPSGRSRQNLSFTTASLHWPTWTLLFSTCARGRCISRSLAVFHVVSCERIRYWMPSISEGISFHSVWRHFL